MNRPILSVIMPTYNSGKYVAQAVESILAQTVSDFEFLIMNEYGSNGRTVEIVNGFGDPRIRIIQNQEKQGIAQSLNIGLRQAEGKYIARMDSDDIALPGRFAKQIQFLDDNEDIALCGTWAEMFGNENGLMQPAADSEQIKTNLLLNVEFVHPTVMFRADAVKKHKIAYCPQYLPEDFELFSRLSTQVKMANVPEILLKYRVGDSTTKEHLDKVIEDSRRIIARNLEILDLHPTGKQLPFLHSIKSFLRTKEDIETAKDLLIGIFKANAVRAVYDKAHLHFLLNRHWYSLFNPYYQADFDEEVARFITDGADRIHSQKCCLFGLGKAGRDLSPYFQKRLGDRLTCVSDNNPSNWGRKSGHLLCVPPDDLQKDTGIIVVANYANTAAICSNLKQKGFREVEPYLRPIDFDGMSRISSSVRK